MGARRKFTGLKKEKPAPRQPCLICAGDEKAGWCEKCRRAYDKFTKRDDATLMSIYKWLTARAWHFARAQAKKGK